MSPIVSRLLGAKMSWYCVQGWGKHVKILMQGNPLSLRITATRYLITLETNIFVSRDIGHYMR